MKIRVQQAKCTGHAMCNAQSPDVFPLDDLGFTVLDGEFDVPAGREDQARRGAQSCPERAIEIVED